MVDVDSEYEVALRSGDRETVKRLIKQGHPAQLDLLFDAELVDIIVAEGADIHSPVGRGEPLTGIITPPVVRRVMSGGVRLEQREQLFDRLARHELEPIPIFDHAEVEELAAALAAAYKLAAQPFADEQFPWAGSAQPMEIVFLAADARSKGNKDAAGLWQIVSDAANSDLSAVVGGPALRSVLEGRCRSIGLFYLLGPLISCQSDFAADLALRKSGRGIWIDGGRLCIRAPRYEPHWTELGSWSPELDWPTDEDILDFFSACQ